MDVKAVDEHPGQPDVIPGQILQGGQRPGKVAGQGFSASARDNV